MPWALFASLRICGLLVSWYVSICHHLIPSHRKRKLPALYILTTSLSLSLHIQCLYAITRVLPFAVDKATLPEDVEPLAIIISRQISYFIEADDFCAFINYLEPDSPWIQAFMETLKEFTKGGKPFKPFRMWKHYERFGQPESLRGLIGELVRFDPDKRLTAEEALGHEWFREGEGG